MKLRKALDKAKKAREENVVAMPQAAAVPAPEIKEPRREGVSPVYSQSRSVAVDPQRAAANRCVGIQPNAPETESYKVLRTKILHRIRGNGWNTIMITSTQPGEGKTLTSVNLAFTFAREYNQTVLLVDGDLKRQGINQCLGLNSDVGLIDYLVDDVPLEELIIWPGIDKLSLISGGRTITESSELLGSPKMKTLVREMKTRYDNRYILFDLPPVLSGADALAFAPLVDCIVMVVEAGRTSRRDLQKALEGIPKEKFIGFVLNRQKFSKKDKYKYYYG
ncbi:MAG: polysaccharide biosynthesis tyrosine autokinase [Desulfobacterales bacterium]|nr:MAG: polysaccharide biosynthesis tyrosine autokinase [Desulfobacterales bacterium]